MYTNKASVYPDGLYLEDLAVGQRFQSGEHIVDEAQIIEFARQFDSQPFHSDPERAKSTFFGGLTASGWHVAALTMKLYLSGGGPRLAEGTIGAGSELSWKQPTRPGDALRLVSEVTEITPSKSRPERAIVVIRGETFNQRDELVQVFISRLVVSRRST
ncbi:MaoC family dehydratase [Noviherbaspirillum sp. Root189]|uniref:MaoC family dehydratase n=1 Tax=Noviherbaspirillum sp. Root189 TaxID=1736487 RepID=UPI00070BCF92|nr:MaoC family dehydratase [Noviherbaspirillum sp. Root189]KRB68981.1 dehydratase [Noviherbaspirillum sp. Root189]